eukprot:scaffold7436_cov258-Pinguiococcus_pyrenoidosus.AAC.3
MRQHQVVHIRIPPLQPLSKTTPAATAKSRQRGRNPGAGDGAATPPYLSRYGQMPEPVLGNRVHAGLLPHVLVVSCAFVQPDVQVAVLPLGKDVLRALHGEGKDPWLVLPTEETSIIDGVAAEKPPLQHLEENGVSIALMDVQIDDENALQPASMLTKDAIGSHCDIGEDAEALSIVEEGMVRATGNLARKPRPGSCADHPRGPNSSARGRHRPIDSGGTPGKSNHRIAAEEHLRGQIAAEEAADVLRAVRGRQLFDGGQRRDREFGHPAWQERPLQLFPHQAVLLHGKAMSLRQLHLVHIVVEVQNLPGRIPQWLRAFILGLWCICRREGGHGSAGTCKMRQALPQLRLQRHRRVAPRRPPSGKAAKNSSTTQNGSTQESHDQKYDHGQRFCAIR